MSAPTTSRGGSDQMSLLAASAGQEVTACRAEGEAAEQAVTHPLSVTALGVPAPQGSHKAFVVGKKDGPKRAIVTDDSSKTKPWKQTVKHAAIVALEARTSGTLPAYLVPVTVAITFRLPRPKGHYGSGRNEHLVKTSAPRYPGGKPDLDKLARSTLDALGEAGVWKDDAQVVRLLVRKVFAGPDAVPGADIRIEATT